MISATLSINSVLNQFHEHLELHVKRAIALIFFIGGVVALIIDAVHQRFCNIYYLLILSSFHFYNICRKGRNAQSFFKSEMLCQLLASLSKIIHKLHTIH
jgi:hypothetical protein